jgi:hypothetical protein
MSALRRKRLVVHVDMLTWPGVSGMSPAVKLLRLTGHGLEINHMTTRFGNPLIADAVQRVSRGRRRRITGSASSRVLSGPRGSDKRESHIAVGCSPAVAGLRVSTA